MAVLSKIRQRSLLVIAVVGIALFAFVIGEAIQSGGFGEKVLDCLNDHEKRIKCVMAAIPDAYVEHGNVELLKKEIGLDAESITEKILERL